MCGRVRLSSDYSEIKIKLKFDAAAAAPNFEADWNKPPTAPMLVAIRSQDGKRTPKMMKWGLIPHWAKDDKIQYSTHNAHSEEFTTKPAFRDAWKRGQRCLLVHNGLYEWKKLDEKGKKKQTYAIDMADGSPMVTAGLWSLWKSPQSGEEILTCTMMTCEPNKVMGELHDRMPVILDPDAYDLWLDPGVRDAGAASDLLKPCDARLMRCYPVSTRINHVVHDDEGCSVPVELAYIQSRLFS